MTNRIDIRVETLMNGTADGLAAADTAVEVAAKGVRGGRGTFFLETFGCQMNEHDSEKVAGLLLARGYQQVERPEAAGLILYNTCSIREKAAQKVFSRLGEYRGIQGTGKKIGLLGCVAQQEGEDIFSRAPWVSLVCGSASYRKLPELLAKVEAGEQRVTGLDNDTEETFERRRRKRFFHVWANIAGFKAPEKKLDCWVAKRSRRAKIFFRVRRGRVWCAGRS